MTGSFEHQSLDGPRFFRILHVLPAELYNGDIEIALEDAVLDGPPPYCALSYAWDAQSLSVPTRCSRLGGTSGILLITPNCAAAIRALRHPSEARTLWIDSICIDQSSIDERNEQVAHMAEIYMKAEKVVVWLGARDHISDAAMDKLNALSDTSEFQEIADRNVDPRDSQMRLAVQRRIHDRGRRLMSDVRSEAMDPITPFFQRSWWHRMWCVQEVVLPNAEKVFMRCDDREIKWTDVLMALDILKAIRYPHDDWKSITELQKHLGVLILCQRYPFAREALDAGPGDMANYPVLSRILLYARSKASTDPKDKIFSLFGVCSQLEVQLPQPDYRKSLEDIYTEATKAVITYDKLLNFPLLYVPSDNRRPGLPSWVQDFSDSAWESTDTRCAITRARFKAAADAVPQWDFPPSPPNSLLVYGRIVDTIMYKTPALPPTVRPPSHADLSTRDEYGKIVLTPSVRAIYDSIQILKEWIDVASWSDSATYPFSEEPVWAAFQRTIVADFPENNAKAQQNNAFNEWLKVLSMDEMQVIAHATPGWPPSAGQREADAMYQQIPKELVLMLALVKGPGSPAWSFLSVALAFSGRKSFYRAEDGRFGTVAIVGDHSLDRDSDSFPESGILNARAGDQIAVVAGLEMPVVLREIEPEWDGQEKKYKLITHCYMHGAMYGEEWAQQGSEQPLLLI